MDSPTPNAACGFDRAEQGLELVREAYPGPLPPRVQFMTEEMLGAIAPSQEPDR